jgi:hypothetical protein
LTLRNPTGTLASPATISYHGGVFTIAASSMRMLVSGTTALGTSRFVMKPNQAITLTNPSGTITMNGQFTTVVKSTGNTIIPTTLALNLTAKTSDAGAQCAGFTAYQNLTGFETVNDWQTTAAIGLSSAHKTQGCFGLSVGGTGARTLTSIPFTTPISGTKTGLSLDIYLPSGQSYGSGSIQVLVNSPSGGLTNVSLGTVSLSGKPLGAFSTLTYAVSSTVRAVLNQTHSDFSFSIVVNTGTSTAAPTLDNLRFTP